MSIFSDNVINPLPKRVRAEQEAIECVQKIVDRVNNNFGDCRLLVGTCNLFYILKNEIICDNKEHKMDLKECFGISAGTCIEHSINKSKDPEKWSGEIEVMYACVEGTEITRDRVWVPIELYRYPKW